MRRPHRRDARAGPVVLVVADDLTGANATGPFARRGLRTVTLSDAVRLALDVVLDAGGALTAALGAVADVLVCDAVDRRDLGAVAAAAAGVGGVRWLSVDPGPFGPELAAALGLAGGHGGPPVLVVAGSVTATTNEQMLEVEQALGAGSRRSSPGAVDPGPLAADSPGSSSGRRPAGSSAYARRGPPPTSSSCPLTRPHASSGRWAPRSAARWSPSPSPGCT